MLSQVAKVVSKEGWESSCVPDDRVLEELRFWESNIRKMNGWTMRVSEDVIYCKDGCINMFSDASNFQLAGFVGHKIQSVFDRGRKRCKQYVQRA